MSKNVISFSATEHKDGVVSNMVINIVDASDVSYKHLELVDNLAVAIKNQILSVIALTPQE